MIEYSYAKYMPQPLYDGWIGKSCAKMLVNIEDFQEKFGKLKCLHKGIYADYYFLYRINCSL